LLSIGEKSAKGESQNSDYLFFGGSPFLAM